MILLYMIYHDDIFLPFCVENRLLNHLMHFNVLCVIALQAQDFRKFESFMLVRGHRFCSKDALFPHTYTRFFMKDLCLLDMLPRRSSTCVLIVINVYLYLLGYVIKKI